MDHRFYGKIAGGLSVGIDETGVIGDLFDPYDTVDFDFGNAANFLVAFGFKINPAFRTDLSFQMSTDFNLKGPYTNDGAAYPYEGMVDLNTKAFMANFYWDIRQGMGRPGKVNPFVGLGLGIAQNEVDKFTWDSGGVVNSDIDGNTNTSIAWKLMLGTEFPINDRFALDLTYAYADFGKAESSKQARFISTRFDLRDPLEVDVRTHEFLLGAKFSF